LDWDAELAVAAGRIDLLLDRVRTAGSIAARRFALDALARGLLLADPGAVGEDQRREALALRVDPSTVAAASAPRSPHAVGVPLVAREPGVGFVRQVHVTFDPARLIDDEGFLDPGARRAIADALSAAARRARPPSDPARHRLVAAQPLALRHARVQGRSLSAAAFVSAVSLWSERPVRDGVVVTGALAGEAVTSVGAMAPKTRAAAAHGAARLVVPAADLEAARAVDAPGLEIVGVADADALLEATLAAPRGPRVRPERAVQEARALFATGWRGYRWPTVREHLARLSGTLPLRRVDLRTEVLTRLAAAHRHLGDPLGSLELLREAEAIVTSDEGRLAVPDAPITYLWQQAAMTHRQLCHFEEAARAAERGVEVARRARLRGELIKALGCLGLVAISRGRSHEAVEAFAESLEVTLAHEPDRTARTRAYLIDALARAGDAEAAGRHFAAAMREVEAEGDRSRESWVRTSWAGALARLGRPAEAIAALDVPAVRASLEEEPLPGLLARRHLGVALCARGEPERGFEILAASPLVHGRALEPHLRFLAHLNVLFEARARLAAGAFGADVAGRARRALEHVPRHGRVPRFLGEPLEATRRALAASTPGAGVEALEALEALLERCERLG
jgi:tetratricopeptide (TPR) repeat protein